MNCQRMIDNINAENVIFYQKKIVEQLLTFWVRLIRRASELYRQMIRIPDESSMLYFSLYRRVSLPIWIISLCHLPWISTSPSDSINQLDNLQLVSIAFEVDAPRLKYTVIISRRSIKKLTLNSLIRNFKPTRCGLICTILC